MISTDAVKLASFDIPTRDNIHRYQCNDPIIFCGCEIILKSLKFYNPFIGFKVITNKNYDHLCDQS